MFVELMPLLKDRTLLLTIARVGEKVKVNVIPAKAKEGEDQALTTPLSYTGSPESLSPARVAGHFQQNEAGTRCGRRRSQIVSTRASGRD